jgi:hypothetical protein
MKKFKSKVLNSQEQSSFNTLTDREKLIYLAGVFEGEGSISGHWPIRNGVRATRAWALEIAVEMSDEDSVLRFKDFFKLGSLSSRKRKDSNLTTDKIAKDYYKRTWTWKATTAQAYSVLLQLRPFFSKRRIEQYNRCCQLYKQSRL